MAIQTDIFGTSAHDLGQTAASLTNAAGIFKEKRAGLETYRYWHSLLDDTIGWLRDEHWNGWRSWDAAERLKRGQQWSDQISGPDAPIAYESDLVDDVATVPMISVYLENLIAFLARSDPEFIGRPRRPGDIESAEVQENLLNYYWREMRFSRELRKAIRDFGTIGHCVMRTDFYTDIDWDQLTPKNPNDGAILLYDEFIRRQSPAVRRVNPYAFLIDRTATDLSSARWCGEIIARPIQDIIEDQRYDKSARRAIANGTVKVRTLNEHLMNAGHDADDELNEHFGLLVEVWDKRYRTYRVFALGVPDFPLLEKDWPYEYLDGFPYAKVDYLPVSNQLYGMGFAHLGAHTQLLLNRVRTKQAAWIRRYNGGWLARGFDDPKALDVVKMDQPGYVAEGGPASTLEAVDPPRMGEDFWRLSGVIDEDLRRLSGQDDISGGQLHARTSAQEVRTRADIFGQKVADDAATIDGLVVDIGTQLLQHLRANLKKPVALRIAGRLGDYWLDNITAEDIRAEIDVEIRSSTREVLDPQVERQQAIELTTSLTNLLPALQQFDAAKAQAGIPVQPIDLNSKELLKYILSKYDEKAVDRFFPAVAEEPTPSPPLPVPQQAAPPPAPTDPAQVAQSQQAQAEGRGEVTQ
jgi:hypothetical protein